MNEKTLELYQEYLSRKLDTIINIEEPIEEKTIDPKYKKIKLDVFKKVDKFGKYASEYVFLDEDGYELFDKSFDKAREFQEGIAAIYYENKGWNFINENGDLISDTWFKDVGNFYEGFASVFVENKGWNFINKTGDLISKTWYKKVREFENGFAAVYSENDGWSFINDDGNVISDRWYREVRDFRNGFAAVYDNTKGWNFIDKNGKPLCDKWYYKVEDFVGDYAVVNGNSVINKNGKPICNRHFDGIVISDKFIHVRNGYRENILGYDGELLINWYNDIDCNEHNYNHGCYYISCINGSGDKRELKERYYLYCNDCFVSYLDSYDYVLYEEKSFATPKKVDLGEYKAKKILSGYRLLNKNDNKDKYDVKYKPVKVFDKRYTLCMNGIKLYLYDRTEKKYIDIGITSEVVYDDNCIYMYSKSKNIIHQSTDEGELEKVLLIYNEQIHDISDYYREKLKNQKFTIKKGFSILSKDEFFLKNVSEIKELIQKEKEEDERRKEDINLQRLKEKEDKDLLKNKEDQKDTIKEIELLISKLELLETKTGEKGRIKVSNLFITVEDHKEINPLYIKLDMLKHIDLSLYSFENVKIDGIDFRGCNIDLKPQEVYMKNLSHCNFEGIYIHPFTDFTDVDIRGSKFSDDNDHKTIYDGSLSFADSIYDKDTTYNGISFIDIYGECNKINVL